MKVKSESEVVQSCPTLSDLMDCSLPAPPSTGFSRQEYWSGVPLPSYWNRARKCQSIQDLEDRILYLPPDEITHIPPETQIRYR